MGTLEFDLAGDPAVGVDLEGEPGVFLGPVAAEPMLHVVIVRDGAVVVRSRILRPYAGRVFVGVQVQPGLAGQEAFPTFVIAGDLAQGDAAVGGPCEEHGAGPGEVQTDRGGVAGPALRVRVGDGSMSGGKALDREETPRLPRLAPLLARPDRVPR